MGDPISCLHGFNCFEQIPFRHSSGMSRLKNDVRFQQGCKIGKNQHLAETA
jgi:hypothetical protein